MKKILLLFVLFALMSPVYAQNCETCRDTKCMDLMTSMYDKRATLYNVLNLSADQQKCKDTIDKKYTQEVGEKFRQYEQEKFVLANMKKQGASDSAIKKQEKVVTNLEKYMQSLNNKYEKEFRSVLNSEQKAKLSTIRKMEKKEIKYCRKQKAFYKRDPKLRPFGEKMYYTEDVLCPVHNKWHLFGYKHKVKN